jgi:hypothetical protein
MKESNVKIYSEVFGKNPKCYHFPELPQLVNLCMESSVDDYKKQLKEKVKKAIDVIQELPIDETSKQGGISALKLILNE